MKISQFSLRNFKGFEEVNFDLDDDFTLFVGENGSGLSISMKEHQLSASITTRCLCFEMVGIVS